MNVNNVTCLVGKNESGKTAFLQALHKLNPVEVADGSFDILEYPRKGFSRYKKIHEESPAVVICAEFEFFDKEKEAIENELGAGFLKSKTVKVSKNYKNECNWNFEVNEKVAIKEIISQSGMPEDVKSRMSSSESVKDLISFQNNPDNEQISFSEILKTINSKYAGDFDKYIIKEHLEKYIPHFVYFDDYSIMQGMTSIQNLSQKSKNKNLNDSDRSFLSLLSLAGTDLEEFENSQNYERLKAELEAASICITDEVFKFWTQNKKLEVEFDISSANPNHIPPLNTGTILHIRIKNNRHRVSVPFDERSKGFVWFFSFLAYFSQFEEDNGNLVLLLDEPGLSLHAKAQNDFLRFIDERLAPKYQVIYTTHSPFMINPRKLESLRTVQDLDGKGTIVSEDVLRNDKDTVFPLQAALGYELAQTLFIGPTCLLVEGPSDLIYLQLLNQALVNKGKIGLNENWVVVPVGGADKLSTFVSLLGSNELDIAVLMDISLKDKQRINNLVENHLLSPSNIITIGEITNAKNADIEDIFEPAYYLKLINGSYEHELDKELLLESLNNGNPRIVKRIEEYFKENNIAGGHFNHYRPAVYLLKEQVGLLDDLSESTVETTEKLFERINSLLTIT